SPRRPRSALRASPSSAAPCLGEKAQPVAADHPADAGLGPAALLHRRGQVGKLADRPEAGGIDDLAELDDQPALALVAADILEELRPLVLGEIGADADALPAGDVADIVDGGDIVFDGG